MGCCCCCTSQLFFSVTLGAGLGVECLSNNTRSPFSEITLQMQSPGTGLWVMIANEFACQNCNPWSCALDNFYPVDKILITFPITVIMHFLRNRVIIMFFVSSSGSSPQGSRGVKKSACRALSFSFPPGINPLSQVGLNIPRTNSVKDTLFPIARNRRVSHQFWH